MKNKRYVFFALTMMIVFKEDIKAQEVIGVNLASSQIKPFADYEDAKKLCECLVKDSTIKSLTTKNFGNINHTLVSSLIRNFSHRLSCLDINNDKSVNSTESNYYKVRLFDKLTNGALSCEIVNSVSEKLKKLPRSYTCRANGDKAFATHSSFLNPGRLVVSGKLDVLSAHANGDIFRPSGSGYIEFSELSLKEVINRTSFPAVAERATYGSIDYLIDRAKTKLDKYVRVPSHSPSLSISTNIRPVSSSFAFKKCGNPNIDKGHLARAYCELKDLNGLVYAEPLLNDQRAAFYFGDIRYCLP